MQFLMTVQCEWVYTVYLVVLEFVYTNFKSVFNMLIYYCRNEGGCLAREGRILLYERGCLAREGRHTATCSRPDHKVTNSISHIFLA